MSKSRKTGVGPQGSKHPDMANGNREIGTLVKSKFKLKLTIEERILLHIRDFTRYEHNLQAPFALTQDGIAKAVSVVRSAIPRSMKKLVDKGFVNEDIGHVEGVVRRRKIYYLTTSGLVRAQEIMEKLEGVRALARNLNDETKELRLSEINKFLGTEFSILELLEGLTEEGIFDYPSYASRLVVEKDAAAEKNAFLAFVEKAPKLAYFIGRKRELEKLNEWLEDPVTNIILVHGIAGIGKTTLALKVMDRERPKMHMVWFGFHQWDTLRYFLRTIAQFLSKLGRRELLHHLETEPVLDLNTVSEILESSFADLNLLIIVDDFHKAREEVLPIFNYFVELLERIKCVKLLIFSRNIIPFYDRRHVKVKKIVGELLLEGLEKVDAKELLEHRGLPDYDLDTAYKLTAGHPLSLELLEEGRGHEAAPSIDDMNIYIQEEIFTRLPESERKLLAFASVYRYGVPKDILLEKSEGGFETLKDLTDRALLEQRLAIYNVHDLIREFFYETQPASVRKTDHSQAADHYLGTIDKLLAEGYGVSPLSMKISAPEGAEGEFGDENPFGGAVIEGLYHLIHSGRAAEAAELAAQHGERVIEYDLTEELKELLHLLPQDELEGRGSAVVLMLLGEIYNHLRDNDAAQNYYMEALSAFRLIHGESIEPKRMALIYRRLGFIHERRDEWDTAKNYHEQSLELAEKAKDGLSMSDAYGALGWLYWNSGDHERANDYYNKCIGMADQIPELPVKAKIYLGMCMALAKRGELEEALEYYEKCLDILERNEDIFKLARSYEGMGDHYLRSIFSEFMKSSRQKLKE